MSDDDNIVPFKGKPPPPPEDEGDEFLVCPECDNATWTITSDFRMFCTSPLCDFETDAISQE